MSLWLLLGVKTFTGCLILDIALIVAVAFLACLLGFIFLKYGEWIRAARSKLLVWFIGRDLTAKPIPAKVVAGQFLDLGKYGKAFLDPLAVYRTATKTKTNICFIYAPYGATLRPEIVVAAQKLKEQGLETLEQAEIENNEALKEGKELVVEVKDPVMVRVQDIVGYFKYTIGPQTLSEAIAYKVGETLSEFIGPTEMKLRGFGKIVLIIIGLAVAFFIVSTFFGGG